MTIFDDIITAQKRGEARGIASICSAHSTVLEATLRYGCETSSHVLIESTCNQVNQFGGYTGMLPADFVAFITQLADGLGFPRQRLVLGGDHLGPEVWQGEPAQMAMEKAQRLVQDYVAAGYLKIHLDASMKLGDDPPGPLSPAVAAERAADLAQVAEAAYATSGFGEPPRYVIGTEVPVPGGARQKDYHHTVTAVTDAAQTLDISRQAFYVRGLASAWERVIALVVQPGVEFGDDFILAYDPVRAADLSAFIDRQPLVYEAHSTDYQEQGLLRQMVVDHFALLKVGPALTYAYREAIFALVHMEAELYPPGERSDLIDVLERTMAANPKYWQKYYQGDLQAQRFALKYSYSDRLRYYWSQPKVQASLTHLFDNLRKTHIPLSLVSQFLPVQYWRIRTRQVENDPQAIAMDKIREVLQDYQVATQS